MKVSFYKKKNGKEPVKESLLDLPVDERASAFERLDGVQKYGLDYSRVVFKPIKGKLWEIKYKYRNQHRFLYCMRNADMMVLLHYVKKKTQKLEKKDRELAEKRMMEVFNNEQ